MYIYITANGFLRYMVRNIIGLLLNINEEKRNLNQIPKILNAKSKIASQRTADSNGLYLYETEY